MSIKLVVLIIGLMLLIGTASADTIIDNFNRGNSVGDLGANWTNAPVWDIAGNKAQADSVGSANYDYIDSGIINVSVEVTDEDGDFSSGDTRFGFAFHIQDNTSIGTDGRYILIFKTLAQQIILYEDSWSQIGATATSKSIAQNDVLKLDVSTVGTGLKIYKNNVLFHTISAGDNTYTSGNAGLYANIVPANNRTYFDNFTVEYTAASGNPVISGISNQTANATVGYIDFTTDVNCDATINYSINADMSSPKWLNASADWPSNDSTTHTIKMIGLDGSTTYYYQIWAYNSSDSSKYSNSTTQTYTTAAGQTWINVAAGESIQHALDNIYPHGTVNVSAGTHTISSEIWVTAHNISVQGQGPDLTFINQSTVDSSVFIASKWIGYRTHGIWLAANNYKQDGLITRMDNYPDEIVNNITIKNMSVEGYHSGANLYMGLVAMHEGNDFNIVKLNITTNGDTVPGSYKDRLSGTYMTFFVNGSVRDTIYNTVSEPLIYFYSDNADCINNSIEYGNAANSIQYNSIRGKYGPCIISDNHLNGSMGKMNVYSSNNIIIRNNIINITASINTGAIHFHIPVGPGYIYDNEITFDCGASCGDYGAGICVSTQYNFNIYGNISNNIIYGSTGHGISIYDQNDRLDWIYQNISENTINGSAKHGLYNPLDQPINATNNIFVNNGWSGIYNTTNVSYNNVWNNALGDYNITSNGTGNISADPLFYSAIDFHLNSTTGTWNGTAWEVMGTDSPCVDAGNPADDYSNEPSPNGSRINMGAYGNTDEASKSSTGAPDTIFEYWDGTAWQENPSDYHIYFQCFWWTHGYPDGVAPNAEQSDSQHSLRVTNNGSASGTTKIKFNESSPAEVTVYIDDDHTVEGALVITNAYQAIGPVLNPGENLNMSSWVNLTGLASVWEYEVHVIVE